MPILSDLKYNHADNLYEIEEYGITYLFPYQIMITLKQTAIGLLGQLYVADWYKTLSADEKSKVKRICVPENDDEWFPDIEFGL